MNELTQLVSHFSFSEMGKMGAVLAVLFGLIIGSFLNVVIIRLPRGRSIVHPSSRCGFCRSSISPWMNIPVLSFICSGGSCSKCGHYYSFRYPLVEALMGVLFLAIWSQFGVSILGALYAAFASALVVVTFIDIDLRIIPDEISIGGWAIALILAAVQIPDYPFTFLEAALGSLLGYFSFWILSKLFFAMQQEEGLGGGDVKLMGFIGAMLGWKGVLTSVLIGSVFGCAFGLLSILIFGRSRKFPIPFGPFLALGALIRLFNLDFWWI